MITKVATMFITASIEEAFNDNPVLVPAAGVAAGGLGGAASLAIKHPEEYAALDRSTKHFRKAIDRSNKIIDGAGKFTEWYNKTTPLDVGSAADMEYMKGRVIDTLNKDQAALKDAHAALEKSMGAAGKATLRRVAKPALALGGALGLGSLYYNKIKNKK